MSETPAEGSGRLTAYSCAEKAAEALHRAESLCDAAMSDDLTKTNLSILLGVAEGWRHLSETLASHSFAR